jgi:apolipoprotein N-acyltransferase
MKFSTARAKLPSLKNSLLAVLSAILLILAFPDFEFWFLAWFALIPLFYAVEREKASPIKSFVLGWIFGTCFFFGSCWWLTFAPINYGGVPVLIAYALLFGATLIVGFFPAIFSLGFSLLLRKFGSLAVVAAPFLWTAVEFLRFYATGNNWNAVGYSQAFVPLVIFCAELGGVFLISFFIVGSNAVLLHLITRFNRNSLIFTVVTIFIISTTIFYAALKNPNADTTCKSCPSVIAIQPNVPMSGLKSEDRARLQERHVQLSEKVLKEVRNNEQLANNEGQKTIIIFPESPMNFEYARDREFQQFLKQFALRNDVSVLFNAAEPTINGEGLYNSAVLVNERGERIAQYDKIHLVPFGEYVPIPQPLAEFVPTMVGNFEIGKSYDLIPFGDAEAGIMICFESHFPTLSREFALKGADILVELTNDGYLGNTAVLRQHLANAVFRAVETNRPVLRVTNVGITAYIDENGKVYDETKPYTEDTRVWTVKKSDAPATFYVKYGDWFAWVCSIASLILLILSFRKKETLLSERKEAV